MAKFESPIGSVALSDSPKMKTYTVDDAATEEALISSVQRRTFETTTEQEVKEETDDEKVMKKFKEAKTNKNKISDNKKMKLEILLGLKKYSETVEIDGHKIVLTTLSAGDKKLAYDTVATVSKTAFQEMFDTRHIFLALSIYSFDDDEISKLLGEENDNIEMRLSLIENLSDEVVSTLYNVYDKKLDVKMPKNEKEAKEVASDIKK